VRGPFQKRFVDTISTKVHLVVDTVIEAVVARDPEPRYLVGPIAKVAGFLSHLPTRVQDWRFQ